MNLILLTEDDFVGTDRVRLAGRRFEQITGVHRKAAGEVLNVGRIGGRMGAGRVMSVTGDSVELEVQLDRPPPAKLPVTLLLALPRPKVLNRVLAAASSLGIERIVLMNCWRVEKSYWGSPRLEPENIRNQLQLGLEQAKDTVMPQMIIRRRFVPFVEDELRALSDGSRRLVAHPRSPRPLPQGVEGAVTIAVGPEGGFIPNEVELLARCGFEPVGLGVRLLRVETVIPFLIGRMF
jgi:16S rRNA (uracil1498-N3)-methyltransferase